MERANRKQKEKRSELVARAKTDPEAMEELKALRAKEAESRARKKAKEEARMAVDPEYAKMMEERRKEYNRRHSEKRKAKLDALKNRAENGDESAIQELAEHRKYFRDAARRNRHNLYEQAAAGIPEAVAKKEECTPLQTWIEPIPYKNWEGIINELISDESFDILEFHFNGRKMDFEDLKRACETEKPL